LPKAKQKRKIYGVEDNKVGLSAEKRDEEAGFS